ncbi:hypothetical protein ABTM93_19765, partial [Acinetobacter baumannii]
TVDETVAGTGGRRPGPTRPVAPIDGFRSARVGMAETALRRAIAGDFGGVAVARTVDQAGRIRLAARLAAPFPAGGDALGNWLIDP